MPDPRPSIALVEAVADRKKVDPTDLPPLYDVVDPDALDTLLDDVEEVSFAYSGYHVTLRTGGVARVVDSERTTATGRGFEASSD